MTYFIAGAILTATIMAGALAGAMFGWLGIPIALALGLAGGHFLVSAVDRSIQREIEKEELDALRAHFFQKADEVLR